MVWVLHRNIFSPGMKVLPCNQVSNLQDVFESVGNIFKVTVWSCKVQNVAVKYCTRVDELIQN